MGLNYFADSKSDTGGGIRSVRTLDLSAKWRPRARVSIYVLRHIAGLCRQVGDAESRGYQ